MSEDLSQASGKGIEIELGGRKMKISPLTMGDLAEFQAYVRAGRLKSAVAALREMDASERMPIIRGLLKEPIADADMEAEMASPSGSRFILWRSLRRAQPDLTIEQVGDLVTTEDVPNLLAVVEALSGTTENPPAAE